MRSCCCLVLLAFAALAGPARSAWAPQKNVEILVGVAAGGALDITAREVQKIWQDYKLVGVSQTVVNRPGGAGAVAWSTLHARSGDGHTLSFASPTLLSNRILGVSPLNYTDFTPIAMLASDYIAFVVNASSDIRTPKDLLDRLKSNPASIRIGNAANVGNSNHVAIAKVAKTVGVDPKVLKIAIFNSGGQSMTNLLGGHVDLVVTASYYAAPQAGKVRTIAVAAPKRLPGPFASVPTWREAGVEVVHDFWRGVIGPPGMTRDQVAYWDTVFAKTAATKEWKEILARNYWADEYRDSARTKVFLDEDYKDLRVILAELGLAK